MVCKCCGELVSQKDVDYGRWRLFRKGYTRKQVLAVVPRCQDCMQDWIFLNHRTFRKVTL